jgi:hypothetical protein
MKAILATPSAASLTFGCDTLQTVAPVDFARLRARGISWRAGYIDHVSPAELAAQLAAGILFSPVTYALEVDPLHTLARLATLKIPDHATVWLDIEGTNLDPTTIKTKINTWASAVQIAGYEAGLYVGAGTPLNQDELWALRVTRYWHSLSDVPKVSRRGYCVRQLRPNDVFVDGIDVDVDVVEYDYKGDLPSFVSA